MVTVQCYTASMQSVGIDCRFASAHAGLGTYTRSMVHALLRRNDPWLYTLFVQSLDEEWLRSLPQSKRCTVKVAPYKPYSFAEQFRFPGLIRAAGCDLFYAPHFNVPLFVRTPFICTVQDLILHRYPNNVGLLKQCAYRCVLGSSVRRARKIVAISRSTADDLHRWYQATSAKTAVISPGVDPLFQRADEKQIAALRQTYKLGRPFLLYVGNCKQHKNVPMLLEAFRHLQVPEIDLVLLSSGKECDGFVLPPHVRRIAAIAESDFPALYSSAAGCVTASLAEGFGLPMAEAMACGCPVLATRCGSLPEVTGDHAVLVEPTVDALAAGMRRLLTDPALRSVERVEAARRWVLRYDWDASAAALASMFSDQLSSLSRGPTV